MQRNTAHRNDCGRSGIVADSGNCDRFNRRGFLPEVALKSLQLSRSTLSPTLNETLNKAMREIDRHSGAGRNPEETSCSWMPACAGMTTEILVQNFLTARGPGNEGWDAPSACSR